MDVLKLKEAAVSLGYEGEDLKKFVVEQQKIATQKIIKERDAFKASVEVEALKGLLM